MKISKILVISFMALTLSVGCTKNNQKQEVKTTKVPATKSAEKAQKKALKQDKMKPANANNFPKKFEERLVLVQSKLGLNDAQVNSINDLQKVTKESLKKCNEIKEVEEKKACKQPVWKNKSDNFFKILTQEQKSQFAQLRKKSEIFIP